MEEEEYINDNETAESEVALLDQESSEYDCSECQKDDYCVIQTMDIDQYITTLNDWD